MSNGGEVGAATARPARAVDVAALETELARLLKGPEEGGDAAGPTTRACMSNLIILAESPDAVHELTDELATVAQRHPSRTLLLAETREGGDRVDARVSALCYPAGGGQQICSEHVEVCVGPKARRRLPSIVRPLLVGDLPTALWWSPRQPPPLDETSFADLAAVADLVVYDSRGFGVPGALATAEWTLGRGSGVADLGWARLGPWRRLVAALLDPRQHPGRLSALAEVEVECGADALPEAWLLIGWLAGRLGWTTLGGATDGGDGTWRFGGGAAEVAARVRGLPGAGPGLRSATLVLRADGGERRVRMRALDAGRIGVSGDAAGVSERVLSAAVGTRAIALVAQLAQRRTDPIFRDSLRAAGAMAKATTG